MSEPIQDFGYTRAGSEFTNNSTASFDPKEILAKMREISDKIKEQPNLFVMTTSTLIELRRAIEKKEGSMPCHADPRGLRLRGVQFMGTPIEDYATVRECMDRMMDAHEGERPQLILKEEIPVDCIDHPWMKQQVDEMRKKMNLDWPRDLMPVKSSDS